MGLYTQLLRQAEPKRSCRLSRTRRPQFKSPDKNSQNQLARWVHRQESQSSKDQGRPLALLILSPSRLNQYHKSSSTLGNIQSNRALPPQPSSLLLSNPVLLRHSHLRLSRSTSKPARHTQHRFSPQPSPLSTPAPSLLHPMSTLTTTGRNSIASRTKSRISMRNTQASNAKSISSSDSKASKFKDGHLDFHYFSPLHLRATTEPNFVASDGNGSSKKRPPRKHTTTADAPRSKSGDKQYVTELKTREKTGGTRTRNGRLLPHGIRSLSLQRR
jgi:hypothetical protein